jgi:anthranilate synthase component I
MIILPPFDDFARSYGRGQAQVVSTKLVSDLETPVSVMLKLARNSAYGFLLESVEGGAVRGRYSMIGLKPDLIWRVEGAKAEINRKALADPDGPVRAAQGRAAGGPARPHR